MPESHPYTWLATAPGELFSDGVANDLADRFPTEGFVRHDQSRRPSGKQYRNYARPLGSPDVETDLSLQWRHLLADLLQPSYRISVALLLGQSPARELELRLVRHAACDGMGPHTDRDDKLFSHVIYFNRLWQEDWGGCLEVMYDCDPGAVVGRIVPRLGASALMARADNSWHQVSKVSDACPYERRSLLIHGLR